MVEQNLSDIEKIQRLSDDLHRVMLDEWAIEKRCIPSHDILTNVLARIKQSINNFTIDALTDKVCKMFFEYVQHFEPRALASSDEDINLIVKTFKYVAGINRRNKAFIDEDDLWVLYILKNVIAYQNNQQEYLEAFKKWRSAGDGNV